MAGNIYIAYDDSPTTAFRDREYVLFTNKQDCIDRARKHDLVPMNLGENPSKRDIEEVLSYENPSPEDRLDNGPQSEANVDEGDAVRVNGTAYVVLEDTGESYVLGDEQGNVKQEYEYERFDKKFEGQI